MRSDPDFDEFQFFAHTDLEHWRDQGVLMLNRALTVNVGNPNSHAKIWSNFTKNLLLKLNEDKAGLVYVFAGKAAQKYWDCINKKANYKRRVPHPAADTYNDQKMFRGCNVFRWINERLVGQNGEDAAIKWDSPKKSVRLSNQQETTTSTSESL
jgi:uracil-DNA glycosylase